MSLYSMEHGSEIVSPAVAVMFCAVVSNSGVRGIMDSPPNEVSAEKKSLKKSELDIYQSYGMA